MDNDGAMELDITSLVRANRERNAMRAYSASIAETGNPNASRDTWNAALATAEKRPLLTAETMDDARAYFRGFGAWSTEELAAMSATELNALTLQYVAGSIREMEHYPTFREYSAAAQEGRCGSGEVYRVGRRFYLDLTD